jgi:hypothetical protein
MGGGKEGREERRGIEGLSRLRNALPRREGMRIMRAVKMDVVGMGYGATSSGARR